MLAIPEDLEFHFEVAFKVVHRFPIVLEDVVGAKGKSLLDIFHGKSLPPRSRWFETVSRVETNNDFGEPTRAIKKIGPGPSIVDLALEQDIGFSIEFMRKEQILGGG